MRCHSITLQSTVSPVSANDKDHTSAKEAFRGQSLGHAARIQLTSAEHFIVNERLATRWPLSGIVRALVMQAPCT